MTQNSGQELAIMTPPEWAMMTQQADMLINSGFLPQSVNTAQKATAIMLLGRELGIAPWAALTSINVIQQKPTVSPQLMLALINRSGQLEDMRIEDDGGTCSVTMKRRGRTSHTFSFSMQDASAMGLSSKDNWRKQPAVMRQWRAVAGCARVVFADVILGLYTPEEMGAEVVTDDQGSMTIIEVKPEAVPQLQRPQEPAVTATPPPSQPTPPTPVFGAAGGGSPDPITEYGQEASMRPDETEIDPRLVHCDRLVVSLTRGSRTIGLIAVGQSQVHQVSNPGILADIDINGALTATLERGSHRLSPSWSVVKEDDDGKWAVVSVVTGIPVSGASS